jgi:hypothetical protein
MEPPAPSGDEAGDELDDDVDPTDPDEESTPRPVDKFRRTAAGTVVAAGLFGLRDALEGRPEREEIAIVNEAPTSPVDGFTLVFDEDDPTALKVILSQPPEDRDN